MSEVTPFCGLHYNNKHITDLSSVISPPYDIISPEAQQSYYNRSPYNIVRLELGEKLPSDSVEDNRYTRAVKTLHNWLTQGVLFQKKEPAFYLMESKFLFRKKIKKRWDLFARVRIEDWNTGIIRPHEKTMEQYKSDRFQLLKSCRVNFSPVLGVVPHDENNRLLSFYTEFSKRSPVLQVTDDSGVDYSVWEITEEAHLSLISAIFSKKPIYIADGHHRYETALHYKKERSRENNNCNGNEAYNFVMMSLMEEADPGLLVLPFHRLVKSTIARSEIAEKIAALFHIEVIPPLDNLDASALNWLNILDEQGKERTAIGLFGLEGQSLYLLRPRDRLALEQKMPVNHTGAWKKLDVSLLHCIILRDILGIDTEINNTENIEYIRDASAAINSVIKGEFQFVFLLNPVSFSSVMAVADAGDRMPPKSTYFYPKPPTGIIMNPLWDNS